MWLLVKVLGALVFYGMAIEPRFVSRDVQTATIPNLPAEWDGKEIAVFSDIHIGMWWGNTDAVRRVIRSVVELKPAFVLIPGDFISKADTISVVADLRGVVDVLRPLAESHIPTYAVLGNHDYSLIYENSDPDEAAPIARKVRRVLDSLGFHMLDNRSAVVYPSAGDTTAANALYLVGIGEKWARNDHPDRAFVNVPANAPRLVFMHDPDSFARIAAHQAPVAIAAHTHAMQINIPFVSDLIWNRTETDAGATGVEGWLKHYGAEGNRVYVTRGVGFSTFPARIHAVPQYVVFTLRRAP